MKKMFLLIAAFSMLTFYTAEGQQRAASPAAKVEQKVGLTDVTLEYSRPGVKDRTIFAADGLVPFGKVWRTGANAASKVTFSDDVKLAGQDLAAGSYAILTIPNKDSWDVHFHTYDGGRWSPYADKTPALAIKATPAMMDISVESFMIGITDLRDYSATLFIAWENTLVPIALEVK